MKPRPEGFLGPDKIDQDGEVFDYVRELHDYLWDFIRVSMPWASGDISEYVDQALILARDTAPLINAARAYAQVQKCRERCDQDIAWVILPKSHLLKGKSAVSDGNSAPVY